MAIHIGKRHAQEKQDSGPRGLHFGHLCFSPSAPPMSTTFTAAQKPNITQHLPVDSEFKDQEKDSILFIVLTSIFSVGADEVKALNLYYNDSEQELAD